MTVVVHKAQRIVENAPTPDLTLIAHKEFPDMRNEPPGERLAYAKKLHADDAETVVSALYASLPGGTLDQILRLLLERKASQLIVTF